MPLPLVQIGEQRGNGLWVNWSYCLSNRKGFRFIKMMDFSWDLPLLVPLPVPMPTLLMALEMMGLLRRDPYLVGMPLLVMLVLLGKLMLFKLMLLPLPL